MNEEESPFVPAKRSAFSTDDLIEEFCRKRTWKYTLLVGSLMVTWLAAPAAAYVTSFAGINPTKDTKWGCKSDRCKEIVADNATILKAFPCDLTVEENNQTSLLLKSDDIEWQTSHSSFSVEFDLNCGVGSARELQTLLSSIYFAGALTGLILGGFLYDQIGRKKTSIIGVIVGVSATIAGTFCHDYYFLLIVRYLMGLGMFLVSTGLYIITVELVPAKQKNYANSWAMILWALGYFLATAIGYFIKDWNYMFLATGIALALMNMQIFLCPESPRFYIVNQDVLAAKRSLKFLQALTMSDLDIDSLEIVDSGRVKDREQSFRQQVKEIFLYSSFLLETLILMYIWFFVGLSYYGFNFGWGSIVPDRYLAYLMASVGELIAYFGIVPLIAYLGRRRAMLLMLLFAAVFFLIAIPDVPLIKDSRWTLESVCCLVGVIFVSGAFAGVYLWTAELAPTSHRGSIFTLCSGTARVGSFLGPYIFNNLRPVTHKAVPLGIMALLSFLGAVGGFFLVETGDKETALTGEDVATRRKSYRYRL